MNDTFWKVLRVAESLNESPNDSDSASYYGANDIRIFRVDYDENGSPVQIQLVGTLELWHRE